jgi:hypothetical protein
MGSVEDAVGLCFQAQWGERCLGYAWDMLAPSSTMVPSGQWDLIFCDFSWDDKK